MNPRTRRLILIVVFLGSAFALSPLGCDKPTPPAPKPEAAKTTASAPSGGGQKTPGASAAGGAGASVSSALAPFPNGAAIGCTVLRGPFPLPYVGTYTLVPERGDVAVVANDNGKARIVRANALTAKLTGPSTVVKPKGLACAHDGTSFFCPDSFGGIQKSGPEGGAGSVVATSRPGTRVAAGRIPNGESVVAYIAADPSLGGTLHAWARLESSEAERVSDEGGGATDVTLLSDHNGLVAVSIDGRAGLTAIHTRRWVAGRGFAGAPDEVLFVAGPGERLTRISAFTDSRGVGYATLAISKGMNDFGQLLVPFEKGGGSSRGATWSLYPNGLDPAPVASALTTSGVVIARIRPDTPTSPLRVLELAQVRPSGEVTMLSMIPTHGGAADVALAGSERDTVWAAFSDDAGGWLEELRCR